MELVGQSSPSVSSLPKRNPFLRKPLPRQRTNSTTNQQQQQQQQQTHGDARHLYSALSISGDGSTGVDDGDGYAAEDSAHVPTLVRHMTLWDLLALGIGGTIGSGLFVLAGLCAHEYAGPATVLSWLLSGLAALVSATSYAELSARIPRAGSAYAYAQVALGELPALLTAVCLSVQYVGVGAAVARSWGDKLRVLLHGDDEEEEQTQKDDTASTTLDWLHGGTVNLLALVISAAIVTLLLQGVQESKQATNIITTAKVSLVAMMVTVAALHVQPVYWTKPDGFMPYGVAGVMRGATGTFFGFLGYDEVCAVAGEVQDPHRNLPRAILGTLCSVTMICTWWNCKCNFTRVTLSLQQLTMLSPPLSLVFVVEKDVVATLALTGLQPYTEISSVAGFPAAFDALAVRYSSHTWHAWFLSAAGRITAVGELLTLPIVTLIALIGQVRLQYALATDAFLPVHIFAKFEEPQNNNNNTHDSSNTSNTSPEENDSGRLLWRGTVVAGALTVTTATLVPFEHLNDFISFAVLLTLSITNSSLILLWHGQQTLHHHDSGASTKRSTGTVMVTAERLLSLYHLACLVTAMTFSEDGPQTMWGRVFGILALVTLLACPVAISIFCPRNPIFGGGYHTTRQRQELSKMQGSDGGDHRNDDDSAKDDDVNNEDDSDYFRTPLVPYLPCLGIFINWYLIAQLDWRGRLGLMGLFILAVLYYYCYSHSPSHRSTTVHGRAGTSSWSGEGTPLTPPTLAELGR